MAKLELTEILHKQERRLGTVETKVEDPNAPVALSWGQNSKEVPLLLT